MPSPRPMLALGFYQDVSVEIAALATVPGEKTPRERFAGAERTFTIEAMMRDGRALQAGTSHFMGTKFAAAFGITFTGESGTAAAVPHHLLGHEHEDDRRRDHDAR